MPGSRAARVVQVTAGVLSSSSGFAGNGGIGGAGGSTAAGVAAANNTIYLGAGGGGGGGSAMAGTRAPRAVQVPNATRPLALRRAVQLPVAQAVTVPQVQPRLAQTLARLALARVAVVVTRRAPVEQAGSDNLPEAVAAVAGVFEMAALSGCGRARFSCHDNRYLLVLT